jgi:TolB protein
VDGSGVHTLLGTGANGWELQGHAEWSPNGQQVVMFGGRRINPQLFVTDDQGQHPRQVTNRGGQNLDPSWSPDGSTIVFIGCPSPVCFERNYEVYITSASGGEATRLTENDLRDQDPYFSPDGSQIAWIAETGPNAYGAIGIWNIFSMSASGAGQRNVTDDRAINSRPQWSNDGRLMYFHRFAPGLSQRWSIYSIHADGTGLLEVDPGAPGNSEYPST